MSYIPVPIRLYWLGPSYPQASLVGTNAKTVLPPPPPLPACLFAASLQAPPEPRATHQTCAKVWTCNSSTGATRRYCP